jgi:hypothetical protein
MKKALAIASILLFSGAVAAQSCPEGFRYNDCEGPQFGPGPCTPGCYEIPGYRPAPTPPVAEARQLCFPVGCAPVRFTWLSRFVIAESALPSGYPAMGWSGPCLSEQCPEIEEQAYQNLFWNARQAHRAARFNAGE